MARRIGSKVPLNVYDGDRPVCQCHNERDAAFIVDLINGKEDTRKPAWLPVETAPKDRTRVDLWLNIYASPRSMGLSDSFRVIEAWHENGKWVHWDSHDRKVKELYEPYITHWMPIAEQPI